MEHIRLTIDFPKEEHVYLKMMCAKMGISIKDFVTEKIVNGILEWEDERLAEMCKEYETQKEKNEITFFSEEETAKELGW